VPGGWFSVTPTRSSLRSGRWPSTARKSSSRRCAPKCRASSVERWDYWRATEPEDELEAAVKCLFLNRTSFSGVLHSEAGPLGGRAGRGEGIAGRWAAETAASRIRRVAELGRGGRITVVAGDWQRTVDVGLGMGDDPFVYADPPYVDKGSRLYRESFAAGDHENLAAGLIGAPFSWLLSYDDHPDIRDLYGSVPGLGRYVIDHAYSTTGARRRAVRCSELLITSTPVPGCGLEVWGEADMTARMGERQAPRAELNDVVLWGQLAVGGLPVLRPGSAWST